MGYAFRFLSPDEDLDLHAVDDALQAMDTRWRLDIDDEAGRAVLFRGGDVLAEVEIGRRGEHVYDDELAQLRDALDAVHEGRDVVEAGLARSVTMLHLRVVWGGRGDDETLDALEQLWDLLFERWEGLLHAESEGFYDRERFYAAT